MKGALFIFALWGVLFALVPIVVDYATRKEFIVHSSGAIIVTGTFIIMGLTWRRRKEREAFLTSRSIRPSFVLAATNHSRLPLLEEIGKMNGANALDSLPYPHLTHPLSSFLPLIPPKGPQLASGTTPPSTSPPSTPSPLSMPESARTKTPKPLPP